MKNYGEVERDILSMADGLSRKETVHISSLLLTSTISGLDKRRRRMVETLAHDVAKLEDEFGNIGEPPRE